MAEGALLFVRSSTVSLSAMAPRKGDRKEVFYGPTHVEVGHGDGPGGLLVGRDAPSFLRFLVTADD
jgi:hypothetical protein